MGQGTAAPAGGLRERARRAIRAEIARVGMELFLRNGFEPTTVEEIAAAAGISRRSFFRYFASKDEVVLAHLDELAATVTEALAARPADEDPWVSLRRAFDAVVAEAEADRAANYGLTRLLNETEALRGQYAERQKRAWVEAAAPILAARLPPHAGPGPDLRAEALVAAALGCVSIVADACLACGPEADFAALLDQAMAAVRPLS
ncbi:TetR family transcriptional regulator [Tepidiforma flava]|uniref:TetR family transcriptional regulator n=1 Tax=Tepidiforma flava TaxID=3004094 RepID=A0ABY7MBM6_9CHLR|nr:TetR/AcrR family transcriptional regulator [Tepidiforma flava]WBL37273.1 TetR family transcriptional regulator [Tepidiforma flava]